MTDIHPKQLENVKHSIQAIFEDNPTPTESNYQHMLKLAAEAAIRAAFKPLPIEDAPKDGTGVIAVVDGKPSPVFWLDQQEDYYEGPVLTTWAGWHGEHSFPGTNINSDTKGVGAIGQPAEYIPIPTQESE